MADETQAPEVPLGMGNPNWTPVPDNAPAPTLPDGRFLDPDDGTPVWYMIPFKGPDHEWTAADLRALRGTDEAPPLVAPFVPDNQDEQALEFRGSGQPPEPAQDIEVDLSAPPRNVTPDGVPHFLRLLPDGAEVCGGCTKPWPCGRVEPLSVERRSTAPDGQPAQVAMDLDRLAIAQGTDVNDLERVVARLRRDEIERTGVDPFAGITQAEDEGRRRVQ